MSSRVLEDLLAAGMQADRLHHAAEAADYFQRALAISPKNTTALNCLGLLFERSRDFARAEEMFKTAIRHASRAVDTYVNLSRALYELKKHAEAAGYCEKGLKHAPTHPMLLNNLGANLEAAGRNTEAAAVFARLAKIHPRFAKARFALGSLCYKAGRYDEAMRHYQQAAELDPRDRESHTCLGECLLLLGRAEESLEPFDRALRIAAYDVRALALKSLALAETGRTDAERWLADPGRLVKTTRSSEFGWSEAETAQLNQALSQFASNHPSMREDPPENATYHCWHSGPLANATDPAIEKLKTFIYYGLERRIKEVAEEDPAHPFAGNVPRRFGLNLWAVRMLGGSKMIPHIHTAGWLSGVYYVDVPSIVNDANGGEAGWIKFGMPRNDIHLTQRTITRTVKPAPGLLVTFPSYLWHDTVPLPEDNHEQRLCLAFDLGASLDA